MISNHTVERRSLLVALALFCTSFITSAVCYARVSLEREVSDQIVAEVPAGESSYLISHEGRCFGTFSLKSVEQVGEVTFTGEGTARVKWRNTVIPLTVSLLAEFNALRQLGGSFLRIASGEQELMLSSLNVRPIALKARWRNGSDMREVVNTSLPGPIEIMRGPGGGFTMYGDLNQQSSKSMSWVSQQPMLRTLEVTRVDHSTCPDTTDNALNLDALMVFLTGLAQSFPVTLP